MARPAEFFLAQNQVWWLLATSLTVAAPLAPHLPPWLSAVALAALGWRVWLAWRRLPLPPRWLLNLLVLAGTGGILAEFRTLFGQNPGVALLVIFLALKQLEARSPRDGLAIVLLSYFLALSLFFFTQTIPAALATLASAALATATLAALNDERRPAREQLRLVGLMLAQAAPLMLLLFILFPRVQGPLWGLPKDALSATTGLSDTMAPGSISQLSQSDAIAFRVRFEDELPPRRQLYWRGPVLTDFDGWTWRIARQQPKPALPYAAPASAAVAYEITLEAHNKPWLFALELPVSLPPNTLATRDFQLLARSPVTQRLRYAIQSLPGLAAGADESGGIAERALRLPAGSNPRTQALGRAWRAQAGSDEEVIRAASEFFLRQGLTYTLSPPLLREHSADEFLFDSRQGFCEHFANAFTIALRAAGIPARVVTGYQGGEVNPVDGYLVVRQYDAHAWTEAWLPGRGWVRIDPTAISRPRRIETNFAAAPPEGAQLPLMAHVDLAWLRTLHFRWDAIANAWNQWVLGYNTERQRDFLRRLGMPSPDWQRMTTAMAILSGLVVSGLAAWALLQRRRLDPAAAAWRRLGVKLTRLGLPPRPWEGPLDLAERVARARPELAPEMRALAGLYGRVRYGNDRSDGGLDELRRRVASFRP